MRIGRLEIGFERSASGSVVWSVYEKLHGSCGCKIWVLACVWVTWLGNECYGAILARKGTALKRLANIQRIRESYEDCGCTRWDSCSICRPKT